MPVHSFKRLELEDTEFSVICDVAEVYLGTERVHKSKWLTLESVLKNELQEFIR